MIEPQHLSASQEEYICTIWEIVQEKKAARATDISKRMGVKGPSVTSALKHLAEKELVNYAPYDIITLTDAGEEVAKNIERRQKVLRNFLTKVLALNPLLAEENAKGMEHSMAPVVLNRLTKFMEYYENCPGEKVRWVEEAGYFCESALPHCSTCSQIKLKEEQLIEIAQLKN